MSSGTNAYLKALEETKRFQLDCSIGYNHYSASGRADQELIKQNNTIINLLIQIVDKIEQIEHRVKQIEEEKEDNTRVKLDSLINQINNLKIGEKTNSNIKKKESYSILFGRK